jgi:hypothetical protein
MMKRLLILAVTVATLTGCTAIQDLRNDRNDYDNPFYAKYLTTGSPLDVEISRVLAGLRENPDSPELHNQLGALLVEKGFPKDAEREFERAVNVDSRYHPAWYNLGLVRASNDDDLGARRAFSRTVDLKPGHAAALFQLGLIEEQRDHVDRAVALYARAFAINPQLLDIRVNPRILDTKLVHLAMLRSYPANHAKASLKFQGGPAAARNRRDNRTGTGNANTGTTPSAPSRQPAPEDIVTPSAPVTDPAMQPPPGGREAEIVPVPRSTQTTSPDAGSSSRTRRRRPGSANPQTPPYGEEVPQPVPSTEPPPQPAPPPPPPPPGR